VEFLGVHALRLHELVHYHHPLLVVTVAMAPTTSTAASPRTLVSVSTRVVMSVVEALRRSLVLLLFSLSGKHSDHDGRHFIRVADLKESVGMLPSLFADGAEVEVLHDTALVANTLDGVDSTAVTLGLVLNSLVSSGVLGSTRSIDHVSTFSFLAYFEVLVFH